MLKMKTERQLANIQWNTAKENVKTVKTYNLHAIIKDATAVMKRDHRGCEGSLEAFNEKVDMLLRYLLEIDKIATKL